MKNQSTTTNVTDSELVNGRQQRLVGCLFCGFPFDTENLGKYGCPNCEGEGLENKKEK